MALISPTEQCAEMETEAHSFVTCLGPQPELGCKGSLYWGAASDCQPRHHFSLGPAQQVSTTKQSQEKAAESQTWGPFFPGPQTQVGGRDAQDHRVLWDRVSSSLFHALNDTHTMCQR